MSFKKSNKNLERKEEKGGRVGRSEGMWTAWAGCSPSQLKAQADLRITQSVVRTEQAWLMSFPSYLLNSNAVLEWPNGIYVQGYPWQLVYLLG